MDIIVTTKLNLSKYIDRLRNAAGEFSLVLLNFTFSVTFVFNYFAMGERKGQNKYYPPDYDPKKGGLNKFLGTHALRERARKIHLGIIIIRFEMPYNIWCEGCNNHIGMGVRYNAEKTKIGMYYSTPVYQFRMKCHLCDNHFEIKTDPGNFDYVIVSGARRQENRWDPIQNEQIVPEDKEVQKKLFDDPMFKLEHQAKDLKAADDSKPVLDKLFVRNLDTWKDNYEANCKLRAAFRAKKKELKLIRERDNSLLAKSSLDITLLPEIDEDRRLAALMRLQSVPAAELDAERRLDILQKPALPGATITSFGGTKRLKLMSEKLDPNVLGIKKKKLSATESSTSTSSSKCVEITSNGIQNSEKESNLNSLETTEMKNVSCTDKNDSVTISNSLSLVSQYSSSDDSS